MKKLFWTWVKGIINFKWIKRANNSQKTSNKLDNIQTNKNFMAKKTVISKIVEENAQDGLIEFPQNRTLYADQFTENAPATDEDREGFKAKSMKEVFEHYQPTKEGIALLTEEGGTVYESFEFKQIKDFDDEQLIAQSELLSEKKGKIDAYNSVIRQLEKNKTLRNALKNDAARKDMMNALQALLSELKEVE
mgnify:CR=1 FL=1|jgi:hypothetical protein